MLKSRDGLRFPTEYLNLILKTERNLMNFAFSLCYNYVLSVTSPEKKAVIFILKGRPIIHEGGCIYV